MDDYLFESSVSKCKVVEERTHYLEIFNYSDKSYNSSEEHQLTREDFNNFLSRTGAFEPPQLKDGVQLLDGIRLIIQRDAQDNETFSPKFISLPHEHYKAMVRKLRLPFHAIEGTALVGPVFWCELDQDENDRHLQIIFRKSDVRKKGKTRGWELMLSYSFNTRITTGYVKGTSSSDINEAIKHLVACPAEVGHPLLLPIIILSHDLSDTLDIRQRKARNWLRGLENAITMRDEIEEKEALKEFDVDALNRDLVECHSTVLWKRPQAYKDIIVEIKSALAKFAEQAPLDTQTLKALHGSMGARLDFYRVKLTGQEHYIHTTLERLHIQRQALYNIMTQKESKLSLEMAAHQRRLAHASKRDSTAMKTLSLLGAVFLPGTFLSSVFSMTFFNFKVADGSEVSNELWIYFIITIPLTLLIVGAWYMLGMMREKRYESEDKKMEEGIKNMEKDILHVMRQKTIQSTKTWKSDSMNPTLHEKLRGD
ncbi:hypothetical protein F5Y17DRAFT_465756 [Xylariaceae sp. FL0594]|nr:hypothetical protein F5Y17DRAFT_465756 [Xylariaceae sp. FL0594]